MQIFDGDILVLDIAVDDDSYRYRAVMRENTLILKFSLPEHVEIPVGVYCEFQGEIYTLDKPENLKMNHTRSFDYTVEMKSSQSHLTKYKFRNMVDRRLKFSMTAKPREHLQMLVDNLNARESGWTVGECVESVEKLISYNHTYLLDALDQMAETFETEREISGKTISLHKVEYNKDNPLALAYGKGKGFKPGIGRTNYEDSVPVEILYVQGGDRNIDASKYGNSELLLPKNKQIRFDGVHFEDENGFDGTKARTYITDSDGYSIRRQDKELKTHAEDSLDCSEIYPCRDEKVLKVIAVDTEKNWYDVVTDAPESLDYSKYGIGGETPTIVFQSGMLAGREFDLETDDDGNIICEKYSENGTFIGWKFQIVPATIDGVDMPGGVYLPAADDIFRVFGIQLPEAYIEEDETKSGASWEMFRQGVKYLYGNEDAKFTFTGTLDGIWAKKDWLNIGGKIKLGGFISFTNEQFQPEPVLIRITGIKDYINNPYSPEIELSNSTKGMSVSSELNKITSNEERTDGLFRDSVNFTKRRFRDARETIAMLEDAMLTGFTDSISPLTVQTMMMLVGDESLQFRFVDSVTNPQQVVHNVEYDATTKILTIDPGIAQHMTLGINSVSVGHEASEYKFWTLPEFNSPVLAESEKKYYVYAKVSRSADTGVFYLSETAKAMESEPDYYYLLMGLLNSEYDGERSYVSLHGFTEVLPGQITTDIIRDSDGKLVIDLANALITAKNGARINGNITIGPGSSGLENLEEWDEVQDKIDKAIAGTDVEYYSSTSPTELKDGEWSTTAPQWTPGRYIWSRTKVSYADGTSSYTDPVCISGNDGDGQGITKITEYYYLSTSPTELVGGEWSTEAPVWVDGSYIWTKSRLQYADGSTVDTDPICVTGPTGKPGEDGHDGSDGTSVLAQYSADGSLWHDSYQEGDIWMRTSSDNGGSWSPAIRIVGKDGAQGVPGEPGADGSYVIVMFAKNTSTTTPPESGWKSEPPEVVQSGEYVWMRTGVVIPPAVIPEGWNNPVRLTGDSGSDGESVYLLDLSNEVATVSCDSEGNVISDMPECTATVYRGSYEDVRFGFSAVFTGCSGSINRASGVINISAITEDTARVSVTASLSGAPTLNAVMTITKVYPGPPGDPGQDGQDGQDGAPGEDAVLYYLLPSADKITKGFTGKIDPESITCEKYRQVGNQTAVIDDTSSIVIKYQRLGEDTYEKTYTGVVEVTADTTAVVFTLYDGSTLIDRERVPVLTDASDLELGSGNLLKYTAFTDMDGLVSRDCSHMVVPDTSAYDNDGQKSARIETFSAMTSAAGTHTISSATVYYARKTETGTIASLSWSTSRPSLTATYRYLYAQLRITYSDGTSGRTVPVLVGQYYSNNAISSVSPYYLATSDETASPYEGSWSTSRPTLTSSSIYMYVHFRTTYGDGTVSKSVAVNAGCYNKAGLELLMWPENLKKDRNLMFSFSVRGVSGSRMYITIDGAETEAMKEAGGWITVNLSTLWSRYTVDFGKITSYSSSENSRLRIIFSATGQYHFNTPILSYGTIQGDWTPAHEDVEHKMTDLEYLRTLFPNSTLVSGATISQMAVVTDGDPEDGGTVVAGLNGTEIGKDTSEENNGKVLIFAGTNGADDDAIKNAATKVYQNGTIDTTKLIARAGGKIGDFDISDESDGMWLVSESENVSMSMSRAALYYTNSGESNFNSSVSIMLYSTALVQGARLSAISEYTGSSNMENIAIYASAEGATNKYYQRRFYGNFAFYCPFGMFAGLRPAIRVTDVGTTLSEIDCVLLCRGNNVTIQVKLPESPQDGQYYQIWQAGSCGRLIDAQGNYIDWSGVQGGNTMTLGTGDYRVVHLVYCSGAGWLMYAPPVIA